MNRKEMEVMKRAEDLRELLGRIDRRGYPAYKDTAGRYQFQKYTLSMGTFGIELKM